MKYLFSSKPAALFLVSSLTLPIAAAGETTGSDTQENVGDSYEIVKATEDRVWRLNRDTGEIAVCSLERERLICTTSVDAATPPPRSYTEVEAERAARAELDARQRDQERERKMAMLSLMMEAFKGLVQASAAPDASGVAGGPGTTTSEAGSSGQ